MPMLRLLPCADHGTDEDEHRSLHCQAQKSLANGDIRQGMGFGLYHMNGRQKINRHETVQTLTVTRMRGVDRTRDGMRATARDRKSHEMCDRTSNGTYDGPSGGKYHATCNGKRDATWTWTGEARMRRPVWLFRSEGLKPRPKHVLPRSLSATGRHPRPRPIHVLYTSRTRSVHDPCALCST